MKTNKSTYNDLLKNIGQSIESGRLNALKAINLELVKANWEIGRHIVEFEQNGKDRAKYGSDLIAKLSKDLKIRYGKGFGRRNVLDMRRFYLTFPIWQTVSAKLSWSHIIVLLSISDDNTRLFYENQCVKENWSKRELVRQIDSSLFERLMLSNDKKIVSQNSDKGDATSLFTELIKDPYVLDFLKFHKATKSLKRILSKK